jgi:hypothetical protein
MLFLLLLSLNLLLNELVDLILKCLSAIILVPLELLLDCFLLNLEVIGLGRWRNSDHSELLDGADVHGKQVLLVSVGLLVPVLLALVFLSGKRVVHFHVAFILGLAHHDLSVAQLLLQLFPVLLFDHLLLQFLGRQF